MDGKGEKGGMKAARDEASQQHKMQFITIWLPKKVFLTGSENKIQFVGSICQTLIKKAPGLSPRNHCLAITSTDSVPVGIRDGILFHRKELITSHEGAENKII